MQFLQINVDQQNLVFVNFREELELEVCIDVDEVGRLDKGSDLLSSFHRLQNCLDCGWNLFLITKGDFKVWFVLKYLVSLVDFDRVLDLIEMSGLVEPFSLLVDGLYNQIVTVNVVSHDKVM